MIGILCAMPEEFAPFFEEMELSTRCERSGYSFLEGRLRGRRAVLCKCGVGKVNAAVCAQTMLLGWHPRLIVNSGVAGALREDLALGEVCVATDVVQYDVDTTALGDPPGFVSTVEKVYFPCCERASEGLLRAALDSGVRARRARIASGDQFIHDRALRARIVRQFDAAAVEMEAGAIAQACFVNGVDCAVVRAISDSSSDRHGAEYAEFMPRAARAAAQTVLRFLEAGARDGA